jgi:hypothetical protein
MWRIWRKIIESQRDTKLSILQKAFLNFNLLKSFYKFKENSHHVKNENYCYRWNTFLCTLMAGKIFLNLTISFPYFRDLQNDESFYFFACKIAAFYQSTQLSCDYEKLFWECPKICLKKSFKVRGFGGLWFVTNFIFNI